MTTTVASRLSACAVLASPAQGRRDAPVLEASAGLRSLEEGPRARCLALPTEARGLPAGVGRRAPRPRDGGRRCAVYGARAKAAPQSPVIIAPGPAKFGFALITARDFAHRYRFARQQGFVGLQIMTLYEPGVGRHPVSLGEHNQVAPYDIPTGNSLAFAVPDDQGARGGEVAQRL